MLYEFLQKNEKEILALTEEKARMLAIRSGLPVSNVIACVPLGPLIAMQVWPALSP